MIFVAGGGIRQNFGGDGGPATSALLYSPYGVAEAPDGDLYIADTGNNRVRRVDAHTGAISTVAGLGVVGFWGDGGSALVAGLNGPAAVAVTAEGDLLIVDYMNGRLRRVDHNTGVISTIAGNGSGVSSGDGGPATAAGFASMGAVAVEPDGDIDIADAGRIRRIDHSTGTISTIAGDGTAASTGDGGRASLAEVNPRGMAVNADGDLYFAEGSRVRRIDHASGLITTVVGTGVAGSGGDGGPATQAQLSSPVAVAVDALGDLLVVDRSNEDVRLVDHVSGDITTVAGTGTFGFAGDGGPATAAQLDAPLGLTADPTGGFFLADSQNGRVRHVADDGTISTVAGSGEASCPVSEGLPGWESTVGWSMGMARYAAGDVYFSDSGLLLVRRIDAATGDITTVAGIGTSGYSGDGGPAVAAELSQPGAVAIGPAGDLFFADGGVVREVDHSTGTITTFARAFPGFGGMGLAFGPDGDLYVTDASKGIVERYDVATGASEVYAGNGDGSAPNSGDGGPARDAVIHQPGSLAFDAAGDLYIAADGRVRRVDRVTGVITTVAGTGVYGSGGDGGPATAATFDTIMSIAVSANGTLFIADSAANEIRRVDPVSGIISSAVAPGSPALSYPTALLNMPDGGVMFAGGLGTGDYRLMSIVGGWPEPVT